jgi:hypothetical protein
VTRARAELSITTLGAMQESFTGCTRAGGVRSRWGAGPVAPAGSEQDAEPIVGQVPEAAAII